MRIYKKVVFNLANKIFRMFSVVIPIKKNLVIFESFLGMSYACNPRYIYEEMLKNTRCKVYEYAWCFEKNIDRSMVAEKPKFISRGTLAYYYYLLRADILVTNSRLPSFFVTNKKTRYIQTWHGTPIKKLALDQENVYLKNKTTNEYRRDFVNASKQWTFLISQNNLSTKVFQTAFQFEREKIFELGYPRCDIIVKHDELLIMRIKKQLRINCNKKIILYAPTFRDNQHDKNRYSYKLELDLNKVLQVLGDDYVIVLRLHYLISKAISGQVYSKNVIDASNYPDISELYIISDLLITDYSSVMFDFALTDKPMFFYMYDLSEYRDVLRGFYFDIDKLPGPILETENELINALSTKNDYSIEYKEKYSAFKKEYTYLDDGEASKRVVEQLIIGNIL